MKGYAFVYGVDGFGADIAPANEEGIYTNFEKAFNHLIKLNHKKIEKDGKLNKEKKINEDLVFFTDYDAEPGYGYYAIQEVEIF